MSGIPVRSPPFTPLNSSGGHPGRLTDDRFVAFPADRFRLLSGASEEQLPKVQLELSG